MRRDERRGRVVQQESVGSADEQQPPPQPRRAHAAVSDIMTTEPWLYIAPPSTDT